jgi:thioesterase domain-containing protein
MDEIARNIEAKLHRDIPLSKHMQFKVVSISDRETRTRLPLLGNTNHLGPQFGGGLFSAAALTCYSTLLGILYRLGLQTENIVIVDSSIRYLLPGNGDVEFRVSVDPNEVSRVKEELQSKGRSRIRFAATAECHLKPILDFTGSYKITI